MEGHTGDLLILDKRIIPEIIRPVPNRIHRAAGIVVEEFLPVLLHKFGILQVRRNFVFLNAWERLVDQREPARGDVVRAYGTGDGIVVEVGARVLHDVLAPNPPASRSGWIGRVDPAHGRCLAVVFDEISQARVIGVRVAKDYEGVEILQIPG